MRSVLLVLFAVLVTGFGPALAQEQKQKARPAKSGDTVVVEGCLKGTMLENAAAVPGDVDGPILPSGLTFQLKGKKDLLKDVVARHDGEIVEITGVLKSSVDTRAGVGTKIGKTRIVIGVPSTNPDRGRMADPQQMLPVLEVKSYESASVICR